MVAMLAGADRTISHITVCPDENLRDRLISEMTLRGIASERLTFCAEISETALPRLQSQGLRIFAMLIDGGHGLPTVFTDFAYGNAMLRNNGYLMIDDLGLFAPRMLYLLLKSQLGFSLFWRDDKTAIFQKQTEELWLPDFGGQPFVLANSM
jgi:hypothetical protein